MTLLEYSLLRRGTAAALARALDVAPCVVSNWIHGVRRVPLQHCLAIERVTYGAVRADTLRPDMSWERTRKGRRR